MPRYIFMFIGFFLVNIFIQATCRGLMRVFGVPAAFVNNGTAAANMMSVAVVVRSLAHVLLGSANWIAFLLWVAIAAVWAIVATRSLGIGALRAIPFALLMTLITIGSIEVMLALLPE